ncbi:MAG: hypothetical protein K0R05_4278 [Anaerocolumna sp.]|jgi:hypothetical protein|nr:hypothetical protein [Anaerocolumna sp.]
MEKKKTGTLIAAILVVIAAISGIVVLWKKIEKEEYITSKFS